MKQLILFAILFFAFSLAVNAQTACPPDKVCLTPEQARQVLIDSDTVKAQAAELAVKDKAIADLEKKNGELTIEIAKAIGEKTGSEQMVVRLSALLDLALKNTRKKCMPFSVCF